MSMFANTHRGYLKALRFITELPKKSVWPLYGLYDLYYKIFLITEQESTKHVAL